MTLQAIPSPVSYTPKACFTLGCQVHPCDLLFPLQPCVRSVGTGLGPSLFWNLPPPHPSPPLPPAALRASIPGKLKGAFFQRRAHMARLGIRGVPPTAPRRLPLETQKARSGPGAAVPTWGKASLLSVPLPILVRLQGLLLGCPRVQASSPVPSSVSQSWPIPRTVRPVVLAWCCRACPRRSPHKMCGPSPPGAAQDRPVCQIPSTGLLRCDGAVQGAKACSLLPPAPPLAPPSIDLGCLLFQLQESPQGRAVPPRG